MWLLYGSVLVGCSLLLCLPMAETVRPSARQPDRVDKARDAWIQSLKYELERDKIIQSQKHAAHGTTNPGFGAKPPKPKPKKRTQKQKEEAQLARGSMFGALFSDMRWPDIHGGGFLPNEMECPTVGDRLIRNTSVGLPMGVVNRALKTVPVEFRVDWSSIPGAGMGVFAKSFISQHTWLAEYEGRVREWTENLTRVDTKKRIDRINRLMDYGWVTSRFTVPKYLIEGSRDAHSNWLRYINTARVKSEQNVQPSQCGDKFFYRTSKPITPGTELLTNYGTNYMYKLGIDPEKFDKN